MPLAGGGMRCILLLTVDSCARRHSTGDPPAGRTNSRTTQKTKQMEPDLGRAVTEVVQLGAAAARKLEHLDFLDGGVVRLEADLEAHAVNDVADKKAAEAEGRHIRVSTPHCSPHEKEEPGGGSGGAHLEPMPLLLLAMQMPANVRSWGFFMSRRSQYVTRTMDPAKKLGTARLAHRW